MKRPGIQRILALLGAAQVGYWCRGAIAYWLPDTRLGGTVASAVAVLLGVACALLADRLLFTQPTQPADPPCRGDAYLWAHRWVETEIGDCCGGHVGVRCEACGQEVEAATAPAMYDAIIAGPPSEVEPCP